MALKKKYQYKRENILRDVRPLSTRIAESLRKSEVAAIVFSCTGIMIYVEPLVTTFADLLFVIGFFYFIWLWMTPLVLPFKLPKTADRPDKNNVKPGGAIGPSEGILYVGNDKDNGEEIWFTNSDARTHILYLGTTGAGKTEGLKSIAANALCWGSGFLYIDGKADTDLWSTISAMARRFGRDDDLLIMNYMTGNVGGRVPSNTMNPFSSGSAGYLVNMLTSLMPDAEGDNAMWKERAVALVSALMPCLVWKRDNQNLPISVSIIRKYMGLGDIIQLSRESIVPEHLRAGLVGYLNELPGYVDEAFDDDGNEKPLPPDAPPFDSSVPRQQHGYLSMQFTRSLQSLGDDYGFIFDTQAADIDMMDVVLQRRIMITLIPALEKSSDETANLGKIIASTLKGMMGATLGSTVEGSSETAIENKPARSETPFISIFDEVGYYAAQGMAVMAAQARSLGFCLVYAAQDLPAMEKRVKEEARSITANCNIKLFGKLEDPTQTKEFFEKTVGQSYVTEVSSFSKGQNGQSATNYADGGQASIQVRARADYDELRSFTEGRAICAFGADVTEIQVYYSSLGFAKEMRVHRFLPVAPPSADVLKSLQEVKSVLSRLRSKKWDPRQIPSEHDDTKAVQALVDGYRMGETENMSGVECSALAIANLADSNGYVSIEDMEEVTEGDTPAPSENQQGTPADAISAAEGHDGPLSWMDVIGGGGAADSADQSSQAPNAAPVADQNTQSAAGDTSSDGLSWDQVIGDSGAGIDQSADQATPPEAVDDELFNQIFGETPGAPQGGSVKDEISGDTISAPDVQKDIQPSVVEPMSWANIMGMPQDQEQNQSEDQSQPPLTAPESQDQPKEAPDKAPGDPQSTFDFSDLLPQTLDGEQTSTPDAPSGMSWSDVIGAPDAKNDDSHASDKTTDTAGTQSSSGQGTAEDNK